MSRRSQAFASGQPVFSWRIEKVFDQPAGRERYKATCRNHPTITGWGDDEQRALLAAQEAMTTAVETAGVGMKAPGVG